MHFLLFGLAAFLLIFGLTRFFKRADKATISAFIKAALLVVASGTLIFMALTGRLPQVIGIAGALLPFLWPWLHSRARNRVPADTPIDPNVHSRKQALDILGLGEEADEAAIHEAYKNLMKKNHPDQGGSPALAQMLNAARDYLLRKNP